MEPTLRAMTRIKRLANNFRKFQTASKTCVFPVTPGELSQRELFKCCFPEEISALMEGMELHRTSSTISVSNI